MTIEHIKHNIHQLYIYMYIYIYIYICGIEPKDPTKREDYWIHTLKTKAPLGLNVEDGL